MKRVKNSYTRKSATTATDSDSDIISNSNAVTLASTQPRRVSFTDGEKNSTTTAFTVERDLEAVVKNTSINAIGANQQTASTRAPRRVSFSELNQIHIFRS